MDILDVTAFLGGESGSTIPRMSQTRIVAATTKYPINHSRQSCAVSPSIPTAPSITVLVPILDLRPPPLSRSALRDTASPVGRWDLEGKTRPITASGASRREADELNLRIRL